MSGRGEWNGTGGRRRRLLGLAAGAAVLCAAGVASADGDVTAGRRVAAQCSVCHGYDGMARLPDAPNIGGESAMYIRHQLENFRSGARTHPQMSIIARGLSDEEIADVAAYYAAIVIEVVSVPE